MATNTKNLNLKKPSQEDFYNVDDFNENFQKLDDFAGRKDNPHNVTAEQIGLSDVDNTSDANKPVSNAQANAIADAKKAGTDAQTNLNSHTSNKSNPHGVTHTQVGAVPELLGNSINDRIIFLLGDHNRLKNHVDADVPSLPVESNYLHMHTIRDGKVKTCLSIPIDYGYDVFYYTAHDKTWRKIADASKFLPLTGGTISGNSLRLNNGNGQVWCDPNNINMFSKNDPDKNAGRYLGVYNSKNSLHDSVTLTELFEDGSHKVYRLFGEHNASTLNVARIITGTYTGQSIITDVSNNGCSLTFDFEPKILHIFSKKGEWFTAFKDGYYAGVCISDTSNDALQPTYLSSISFNGNTVSWTAPTRYKSYSAENRLYSYIAFK